MRAEHFGGRSAFQLGGIALVGEELEAIHFEDGLFGRKLTGLFELIGQFASGDFAGFDVGLIEGVDADYRTGHGDGNLPAEEFRTEVVAIGNIDADDGMAGLFEERDGVILRSNRRQRVTEARM